MSPRGFVPTLNMFDDLKVSTLRKMMNMSSSRTIECCWCIVTVSSSWPGINKELIVGSLHLVDALNDNVALAMTKRNGPLSYRSTWLKTNLIKSLLNEDMNGIASSSVEIVTRSIVSFWKRLDVLLRILQERRSRPQSNIHQIIIVCLCIYMFFCLWENGASTIEQGFWLIRYAWHHHQEDVCYTYTITPFAVSLKTTNYYVLSSFFYISENSSM